MCSRIGDRSGPFARIPRRRHRAAAFEIPSAPARVHVPRLYPQRSPAPLLQRPRRLSARVLCRVIAVSEQMKADMVASGVASEKVSVITNAVSTGSRRRVRRTARNPVEAERRKRRLRVRIRRPAERREGSAHLLQAAGRLWRKSPPSTSCWSVRARAERARRLQSRAGLNGHVHFAGFQSETSSWFQAMDAFVLPSLTEGTPMALLEAMALRAARNRYVRRRGAGRLVARRKRPAGSASRFDSLARRDGPGDVELHFAKDAVGGRAPDRPRGIRRGGLGQEGA